MAHGMASNEGGARTNMYPAQCSKCSSRAPAVQPTKHQVRPIEIIACGPCCVVSAHWAIPVFYRGPGIRNHPSTVSMAAAQLHALLVRYVQTSLGSNLWWSVPPAAEVRQIFKAVSTSYCDADPGPRMWQLQLTMHPHTPACVLTTN